MTRFEIRFARSAAEHVATIQRWWAENRPAAVDLFEREFHDALKRLAIAPRSGQPYRRAGRSEHRRLLLQRSRYHLYYFIDEPSGIVTVKAVWHCSRGTRPRLR